MAAVLACGPAAVLSHRAAAALWGLRPTPGRIEVTVGTTARRVPGLLVHRSRMLHAGDITYRDQIPVTSVARTLLDLAGAVPPDHCTEPWTEPSVCVSSTWQRSRRCWPAREAGSGQGRFAGRSLRGGRTT